jgi:hypothetical protein
MSHHVGARSWKLLRKSFFAVAAVAAVTSASCQNSPEVVGGEGRVVMALTAPDGTTISSVSWVVASSSNQTLASGTTNTSHAGATASFIVGIPAGTGDVVTMTAVTAGGTTCSGTSNPFDVTANHTASVSVTLNCSPTVADGGLGSVVVTGTVVAGDNCPTLTGWMISPQTAMANGGTVDVSVTAADADTGDHLSYAWSATAGTFASATSAATTYTCGAAGTETLHVVVSDDHTPTPCSINIAFPSIACQ